MKQAAFVVRVDGDAVGCLRVRLCAADELNWNSNEMAASNFLTLLQDAKDSMVVHDDGNKMEGSIYQNQGVIDAVRTKLSENPRFRLSCHFNFDDAMPFTEALKGHPRVQIVTGDGERPDDDSITT